MDKTYRERIDDAVQRLASSEVVPETGVRGCSDAAIEEIERAEDVSLPDAYVAFLEEMGESAGDFLRGDDLFYPQMIGLTDDARQLLAESGSSIELGNSEFVFAGHQDYSYLYFDTEAGEDPAVYRVVEGNEDVQRVFDAFSKWVESSVEDELSLAEY